MRIIIIHPLYFEMVDLLEYQDQNRGFAMVTFIVGHEDSAIDFTLISLVNRSTATMQK